MQLKFNKASWAKVAFGDVVKKINNKINPDEYHSSIVVEGGHINKRDFHIRTYENKNELGYLGPAFHMGFRKGQILYVSRNPHLMKVGYPQFDGICANTTFILETKNNDVLLNELIPFIMHSDTFIEQSVANVRGGVNPYVNWGDLAKIEIFLPPLNQQKEIIELLTSVNEVIETELTTQSKLRNSRILTFEKIMAECHGANVKLSKVLVQKTSKSQPPHSLDKYIGLEHIEPGEFELNSFDTTESVLSICNIVSKGDLCFSKLRPYLDKAAIANFDAISTTELLVYDTDLVSKLYVLFHLHSRPFLSYVTSLSFGTKMPRVSHEIIGEFSIPIPKDEAVILNKMEKFLICSKLIDKRINYSKTLQRSLINAFF